MHKYGSSLIDSKQPVFQWIAFQTVLQASSCVERLNMMGCAEKTSYVKPICLSQRKPSQPTKDNVDSPIHLTKMPLALVR